MADRADEGRRAPSAQVVAATALGRASWCRRDGAHLFGVRMLVGADRERDLRADDAAALDRPVDLGIDVEAPAVSWQQVAAVLLQAFGRS